MDQIFFLCKIFMTDNHCEYLLSQRVIVYWISNNYTNHNWHDGDYYSIVCSFAWYSFSFKNNWLSIIELWKITSTSNHKIKGKINCNWSIYDFCDSSINWILKFRINRKQLNCAIVSKESHCRTSENVKI